MKERNIGFLFLALGLLAIGQVIWWSYLLVHPESSTLNSSSFKIMIASEAAFFVFVWGIGMWMAYRYFLKQIFLRKTQKDFIAAVTHELKTPLTNIRLCLDTLERVGLNEDMKSKYLSRAQTSVDRLANSVDTILTLSSTQEHKLETQSVEINQFLQSCIDSVKSHLEYDSTEIAVHSQSNEYVELPPEEGRLIIQNLIDNALKYSLGKKIEIFIEKTNTKIILKIKDQGVGLTSEELKKVFEPFWRSDWATAQAKSGTGLGLTLTKSLCDRAGLHVELKSEGPEKGTTAVLEIPMEKTRNG